MAADIISILQTIKLYWRSWIGFIIISILESIVCISLKNSFLAEVPSLTIGVSLLVVLLITFLIWLTFSGRLCFRYKWVSLIFFLIIIGSVCVYIFYFYPHKIKNTTSDLPYIKIWGALIILLITISIVNVIKLFLPQRKGLIVILFIDNDNQRVEEKVRATVKNAVNNLMDKFPGVRIVVPTFGICSRDIQCERYCKYPCTNADAYIKFTVIDDNIGDSLEFDFKDFRAKIIETDNSVYSDGKFMVDGISEVQKYRNWNYCNEMHQGVIRKINISDNLEKMISMYLGCFLILKNKYIDAVDIIEQTLSIEKKNQLLLSKTYDLLGHAYLLASREEEHNQHNYASALEKLDIFLQKFPTQRGNFFYIQSMARIQFYLGKIESSKRYNRLLSNHSWAYDVNMGFYALYEGKIDEFVF